MPIELAWLATHDGGVVLIEHSLVRPDHACKSACKNQEDYEANCGGDLVTKATFFFVMLECAFRRSLGVNLYVEHETGCKKETNDSPLHTEDCSFSVPPHSFVHIET